MIRTTSQNVILSVAEVIDELDLDTDPRQQNVWNEVFHNLGLPIGNEMSLEVWTQAGTVVPVPLDSFIGLGDDGILEIASDEGAVIRVDQESVIVAVSCYTLATVDVEREYPRLAA